MVKMDDYEQFDHAIMPPWWNNRGDVQETVISTWHGLVQVTVFPEFTRMLFVAEGREYYRQWKRSWGRKTCTRLANQFAYDVSTIV